MNKKKIISEIISGKRPVAELKNLEERYPGIENEYESKIKLFSNLTNNDNIEVDENYFEYFKIKSFEKQTKPVNVYKVSFATAIVIIIMYFTGTFNTSEENSFFTDDEISEIIDLDESVSFLDNEYLVNVDSAIENLPDSLIDEMKYHQIKFNTLVDYYFAGLNGDGNLEYIHNHDLIYELDSEL